MKIVRKYLACAFVTVALISSQALAVDPPAVSAKIGEQAPPFELSDNHGKKHSLSDYQGKYVVLEWFNNGCPFVKKHYESGNMQKLQKEFAAKGVAWLTIGSSAEGKQGYLTNEQASKLLKEWDMHPTAWLSDASGAVGRDYGARVTPHMYVINPQGKLIYAGAIDDKNTTEKADIPSSTNYVAKALNEAMAGQGVAVSSTQPYGCSVKYAS